MKLSRRSARAEWEKCTALDTRLGREVAVKVLPASFSADRDRLSVRTCQHAARVATSRTRKPSPGRFGLALAQP